MDLLGHLDFLIVKLRFIIGWNTLPLRNIDMHDTLLQNGVNHHFYGVKNSRDTVDKK